MNDTQQKAAAKRFAELWKGKGYEKGESQKFWLSLLQDVYGVEHPAEFVTFEEQVHIDKSTGFIDGMIPATRVRKLKAFQKKLAGLTWLENCTTSLIQVSAA